MQPIDVGILVGFISVCAAIAILVLLGPKPKGQYHAHPENLRPEKLTDETKRLQGLRAVAGTDYRRKPQ